MRLLFPVCALTATFACASPTGPTGDVDMASQLNWRLLAVSCGLNAVPSPRPDFGTATITTAADGSLVASWPYVVNGRNVMLFARFVRENGAWAMCSWDTADV